MIINEQTCIMNNLKIFIINIFIRIVLYIRVLQILRLKSTKNIKCTYLSKYFLKSIL